jgi:hypothetical protein
MTLPVGLHQEIPFAEYLSIQAVSKSLLLTLRKTPAHCLAAAQADDTSTPSQRLGSLAHTLILEPDQYAARYAVGPDARGNSHAWKDFVTQAERAGLIPIRQAERVAAQAMADAFWRKPVIHALLATPGPVESSMLWEDALVGLCKGRPDKIIPGMVIDLKTTRDLSDRALARTIYDYGYHIQARHYLDGAEALGLDAERFVIVWAESVPPHEIRATEFLPGCDWLELAEVELTEYKHTLAGCRRANLWPGYIDEVVECPPPPAWLHDHLEGSVELVIGGQKFEA